MPELPEVETIVRDIRPALLGRRLDRVSLSHDDVLRGVSRRRLVRDLTGATVATYSAAPSTPSSTSASAAWWCSRA